MDHLIGRMSADLVARVSGPMKFRLVLQPGMAIFLAIRDGLKDAHRGKPPWFWALSTEPGKRRALLESGWRSIGRVFILAIIMDVIYQIIVHRSVYPGEAVLVAIILAVVPYLLIRGPVDRIIRREHTAVKERLAGD